MNGAEARHLTANVLHTYTEVADRKDVDAAVALLGRAVVRFPTGGYERPEDARGWWEQLWGSPVAHRHDVTNLVVRPLVDPTDHIQDGTWRAEAHYQRWMVKDEPVLHTLGRYDLILATEGDDLAVRRLAVTQQWSRG
ncbi:hypothetical protein GCM10009745_63400 [Kribbella yunnanensis]|uniref:Nuclear transport factor 2 family protein n=1 Tax=Kribbella yunnanensis TaxID=190194 RepID=A0ABN2IKG8_9ACTN